jgi:hypothetical protein
MTDGAIALIPSEDDTAPPYRVARLSGKWFRDSAVNNPIAPELVVSIRYPMQE